MSPATSLDPVVLADALRPTLLQLSRELRRETRRLGASPEQVSLLATIKYAPGIGIRELAARERVSAAAMTRHVDRLERGGLVARTPSDEDRRRVGITITDEGGRLLRRVRSRRTTWLTRRLRSLTAAELDAIDAAIAPLRALLPEDAGR